jgi:hypothetical protein
MDWMYANCSATAQRGALDWKPKFKKAVLPVFKELYARVASGAETRRVMSSCGRPDYKELLAKELAVMGNSEMWQAGKATRGLRPKEAAKKTSKATKGIAGRQRNEDNSEFRVWQYKLKGRSTCCALFDISRKSGPLRLLHFFGSSFIMPLARASPTRK